MAVISTHNLIANDPQLAPTYLATQEQAITHFEDTLRLLGDESQQECQRRWGTLPYNLKIMEYHSYERMRDTLERTALYKKALQRLKINWISSKLSPPLLLGMLEGRNEEEERKQREQIEKHVGFYPKEENTSIEAWNVREATREMKYMDVD